MPLKIVISTSDDSPKTGANEKPFWSIELERDPEVGRRRKEQDFFNFTMYEEPDNPDYRKGMNILMGKEEALALSAALQVMANTIVGETQ
jgi:hypothetical protein